MRHLVTCVLLAGLVCGCTDAVPATPDAGAPRDQCANASDQAILDPYLVDGGVGFSSALDDILRACAQGSCSGEVVSGTDAEASACMSACYETTAIAGLTTGCQDCWTRQVQCGADNCSLVCLGTDPSMCADCILTYCSASLTYCAGL